MSAHFNRSQAQTEAEPLPHFWRFQPQYFHKIWGGDRLRVLLYKDTGVVNPCGESWELSDVPSGPSKVVDGPFKGMSLTEVLKRFGKQIMGHGWDEGSASNNRFPLLIKFLDARDDLSVQVHPNDELAFQRHGCPGKTEMWYVLDAEPGATLITGFNGPMDAETYTRMLQAGRILEVLNREPVAAGDVFFIPAGRIHTIGRGIVLAEIQQSSDITYRLYDFDRVDEQGQRRELHTEEALAALDFHPYTSYRTPYSRISNTPIELVHCDYFRTFLLELTQPLVRTGADHRDFRIYMVVKGSGCIKSSQELVGLSLGDTVLVSAQASELEVRPDAGGMTLLETGLPATDRVGA
jgi:mannose-6-phosphate isomerase